MLRNATRCDRCVIDLTRLVGIISAFASDRFIYNSICVLACVTPVFVWLCVFLIRWFDRESLLFNDEEFLWIMLIRFDTVMD